MLNFNLSFQIHCLVAFRRENYIFMKFFTREIFILLLFNNAALHYRQRERSLPHITCTSSATQCKPQKRTSPFYADFLSPYNTPADDQEHTQTRVFLIYRAGRGDASLALPPTRVFCLTCVAIRAYSSPYAALRRQARLSRGCS